MLLPSLQRVYILTKSSFARKTTRVCTRPEQRALKGFCDYYHLINVCFGAVSVPRLLPVFAFIAQPGTRFSSMQTHRQAAPFTQALLVIARMR